MTALERLRARMEAQPSGMAPSGAAPSRPGLPARTPLTSPGTLSRPSALPPRPATPGLPGARTGLGAAAPAPRSGIPAPAHAPLTAPSTAPLRAPLTAPATRAARAPLTEPVVPPVRTPLSARATPPLRAPLTASTTSPGSPARPALRAPLSAPASAPGARPGADDRPRRAFAPLPMPTLNEIEQTVDHKAYEAFSDAVKGLLGFDLLQYKRPQVWRRSNSFAKQKGFDSLAHLCDACKTDLELRTELRDMITINVSEFFRNPEAWEQVRSLVLPELLKLGRPIRFWSAGCSLGYEPYTWAMMVKESGGGGDTKILATDLDETILAQARASAYSDVQMVGVSPARKARFFDEVGGRAVVKPELRNLVQWRRQDLLRDPFPSDMDMIACRNVVIYFTDDAKDALYKRFAAALRPGGFLFIGATEAIADWRGFGLKMLTSGLYLKEG